MNMKAVVLAGGSGTRLRPLTDMTPKHLLPVGGKPIIEYGLQAIAALGIVDVAVVVGTETREPLRAHLGSGSRWGVRISYVFQEEPRGIAHALLCAADFAGRDPMILYLGDNLLGEPLSGLVQSFFRNAASAAIAVKEVPDARAFGVAVLDTEGHVRQLVEKPAQPPSNLAVIGAYVFRPEVFEASRSIQPSGRGEYEITDAIQALIDAGKTVVPHRVAGWWKDTGTPADLLHAQQLVMEGLETEITGALDADTTHQGSIRVEREAFVHRSALLGPVQVGAGAWVEGARLGPHVSLGAEAQIKRAVLENCIVLPGVTIEDEQLSDVIVGPGMRVSGARR